MNKMNIAAAGAAATMLATVVLAGPAAFADNKQGQKNTDRNLGIGLGAAAAYEALHGKGTNALLLGAGAAYAGKKYEDTRKEQNNRNNWHRYGTRSRYNHHTTSDSYHNYHNDYHH